MNRDKWEFIYNTLDRILSDFTLEYRRFENGSNLKIRNRAQRDIQSFIRNAVYHIRTNPEVYDLLIGDSSGDGIFEEFRHYKYFDYEMTNLLRKIQDKINSLEM